jgi:hypothetical protein
MNVKITDSYLLLEDEKHQEDMVMFIFDEDEEKNDDELNKKFQELIQ